MLLPPGLPAAVILSIGIVYAFMDSGKWLHVFVMHLLMSILSTFLHINLISNTMIEWIQHEVNEVVHRSELLFSEILNAVSKMAEKKHLTGSSNANIKRSKRQISDLEVMLRKEKAEFEACEPPPQKPQAGASASRAVRGNLVRLETRANVNAPVEVVEAGILIGLRRYRFFVFKDGGKERLKNGTEEKKQGDVKC